jgi:ABC-2 type transport system ATP-binding protein
LIVDGDAGWLRDEPSVRIVDIAGQRAVFELVPGAEERPEQTVLRAALDRGAVRSFAPVVPSLDQIFKEAI